MPQYEVRVTDRIPNSINQKLDQIAVSADQADMSVARLRRNLNFRSSGGFDRVNQSARTSATVVSNASRSVQNYQRRVTRAARANSVFANSTASVTRTMRNLLVIAGSISLGTGIARGADEFRIVDNRISQVSTSLENQEALYQRLFSLAQETRVPIGELANSFQRFDRVLGLLGESQETSLMFTETLTKALIANGSTAQETESAITQLSQGFNSLALQGEELRAVRENVPIAVLQALSEATGESVDQLKELGRQGRLTPSVILRAFQMASEGVFESFNSLVPRLGERFTQLRNAVSDFLRDFERSTGFFETLGDQIFKLANNLETFLNRALGVAAAVVTFQLLSRGIALTSGAFAVLTGATLTFRTALISTGIGAIAVLVGSLIAFRNEIKPLGDGVTTLSDIVVASFNRISALAQEAASSIGGLFEGIFGEGVGELVIDGVASSFERLVRLGSDLFQVAKTILSVFVGIGTAIARVSEEFDRLNNEGASPLQTFGNLFVDAIRVPAGELIKLFGSLVFNVINLIQERVNNFIAQLRDINLPVFGRAFQNLQDLPSFNEQDIANFNSLVDAGFQPSEEGRRIGTAAAEGFQEGFGLIDNVIEGVTGFLVKQGQIISTDARALADARIAEEERAAAAIARGEAEIRSEREQTLFESQPNSSQSTVSSVQQEQLTAAQRINQELQFQSRFILDSVNANRELANSFNDVGSAASDSLSSAMGSLESLGNQGMDVSMSIAEGFNESFEGLGSLLDGDIEEGLPQLLRGISQIGTAFQQQRAMQEQIQGQAQALQNQQGSNSNAIPGLNRALAGNFLRQGDPGGANAFNQNQRFRVQQLQSGFGQRLQGQQGQSNVAQVGQDAQQAQQQIDQATESVNRFSQAAGINSQQGITGQAQNQQGSSLFGGGENQTQSIQTTQQALQMLLTTSQEANTAIQMLAMIDFTQLSTSVQTSSQSFNMLPQAASQAASGVESSMDQILASLDEVIDRANQAASAVAGVGGGGGGLFGGGGGGGLFGGFMRGGFTGNVSRRRVAGVVHGREYVVNAGATRGNRAALEQLNRTGSLPAGGGRSGGVTINNNAGAVISTSNDSNGDLMIEVDRRIERQNQSLDGRLAALTTNPNSRFSKSLRNNTQGGSRRRSG